VSHGAGGTSDARRARHGGQSEGVRRRLAAGEPMYELGRQQGLAHARPGAADASVVVQQESTVCGAPAEPVPSINLGHPEAARVARGGGGAAEHNLGREIAARSARPSPSASV